VLTDSSISIEHLEIFVDVEGNVFLTDLQSENGTFVNGNRISDSIELYPNDVVTVGNNLKLDWKRLVDQSQSNTITIGRAATNSIVLDLPYVSEKHLQLFRDKDGNIFITDLDSAEGTFINGVRLNGIALLEVSDKVKLGPHPFHWQQIFPDLQLIEPITEIKSEQIPVIEKQEEQPFVSYTPKPENDILEKEEAITKKPWYIENKDLLIIYGIDLLLILLISWSMK